MRNALATSLAMGLFLVVAISWVHPPSTLAAGTAEAICPGGVNPDPNVIWCDNFEDGTWLDDWSASPFCCDLNHDGTISSAETEGVTCGMKGFNDNCAAWSEVDGNGDHYADKAFTTSQFAELYARWYVYISNPYRWDPTGDKNFILNDPARTIGPYIMVSMWGTGKPTVEVYQNSLTPCVDQSVVNQNGEYPACVNRVQNVGNDITLQPGKWYLFEWYVKFNTPGVANGVSKLWINDASAPITTQTLREYHTDMHYRSSADAGKLLGRVWLSPYHNTAGAPPTEFMKWDNIVISRAPIGPAGAPRRTPSAPTGLRIN